MVSSGGVGGTALLVQMVSVSVLRVRVYRLYTCCITRTVCSRWASKTTAHPTIEATPPRSTEPRRVQRGSIRETPLLSTLLGRASAASDNARSDHIEERALASNEKNANCPQLPAIRIRKSADALQAKRDSSHD